MTDKKYIFFNFIVFLCSMGVSLGGSVFSDRNLLITAVFSFLAAIILYFIYFRIFSVNQESSIFSINISVFSRPGFLLNAFLRTAALVSALISMIILALFLKNIALFNTPIIVIAATLALSVIIMANFGNNAMSKFGKIFGYILLAFILLAFILNIPNYNTKNLSSLFSIQITSTSGSSFFSILIPFLEGFFLLCLCREKEKKYIIPAIVLSYVLILSALVRCIVIFGYPFVKMLYYPNYAALSLISFMDIITKAEILLSVVNIVGYIYKSGVLLLFVTENKEHKKVYYIIFFLCCVILAYFTPNMSSLYRLNDFYKWIMILPLIIIPVIILIASRIKKYFRRKSVPVTGKQ